MLIRHPKHQPPVTLPQKAAQRFVPVDNHNGMGRSGQSLLQPAGNIGRVGIAEHRVPGQIADHHIVRLKRREVQGRDQLVQFHHHGVLSRAVEEVHRVQQAPGHTCMMVGPPIVEGDALPLLAKHPGNEGGNGGLPVGPRDHNGQLGLRHVSQKVPVQPHSGHAGLIVAHMSCAAVPK